MTNNVLTKLSNFVNSPENPAVDSNHREYVFGELLALTEILTSALRSDYPLTQSEMSSFEQLPMSTYAKIHANIVGGRLSLYAKYQEDFSHIMNKFSFDEFTDEPLKDAAELYKLLVLSVDVKDRFAKIVRNSL